MRAILFKVLIIFSISILQSVSDVRIIYLWILWIHNLIIKWLFLSKRYISHIDKIEVTVLDETAYTNANFRVGKFNRTSYIINGSITVLKGIGENTTADIIAYMYQGNEYRKLNNVRYNDVCSFMKTSDLGFFYPSFVNHSNLPPPGDCPIPPNTYIIHNYPLSDFIGGLPHDRKWKINIIFSEHGVKQLNVVLYVVVDLVIKQ